MLSANGKLKVASTAGFVTSGTLTTDVGNCTYTSISTDNDSSGNSSFYFNGLGGACLTHTLNDKAKVFGTSQQTHSAAGQADGKSKTADNGTGDNGNQNFNAALAVVVFVVTTRAYIAPSDDSTVHSIKTGTGNNLIHAGATNVAAATGDAGNVKFSPSITSAPTSPVTGTLADGTYYYKVTATFASGESLASEEKKVVKSAGGGTGHIDLNWAAIDGATGYKVYRGTRAETRR